MHEFTPITERKATQSGALNHYGCECTCGHKIASTIKLTVQADAVAHIDYMTKKEGKG